MKYFSMFSGIGGFELGIKYALESKLHSSLRGEEIINAETLMGSCIGFSEVNKYAIQCYEQQFKGHKNYGDANRIVPEELPDFDFLCGGFPCQAFSIAGKRGGFDDTRGTLFFEIARILKVKRPKHFLLENVKGLLSHDDGRTFKTIISTLAELGYGVEWQVLNSKDFGVPQNRERVFIVGHLGGIGSGKVFPITRQGNANTTECKSTEGAVARTFTAGGHSGGNHSGMTILSVPTKFLDRNQRNYQGDYSFTVDIVGTGGILKDARIRRLTPTECERLQGFPDGWTSMLSDSQRYKCLGNAVTVNVIEAILQLLKSKGW